MLAVTGTVEAQGVIEQKTWELGEQYNWGAVFLAEFEPSQADVYSE